ncbi:MAG: hypothetical protein ABIR15_23515 [Chitinophagaceae bacterium]
MKVLLTILVLSLSVILIGTSCKKQSVTPGNTGVLRKVQFSLYTDKDFSGNNGIITFKLSMQNSSGQVLWDSLLAPVQIKDIPGLAHKLVVEKQVPGNDNSLLKVGFFYTIENVGNSWHLDAFNAGETFKIVEFNFQ